MIRALCHLFLRDQVTRKSGFLKQAPLRKSQSRAINYSNSFGELLQLLSKPLAIQPDMKKCNQEAPQNKVKKSASLFLKMPPQEEMPGLPLEAPSILHLIQLGKGGFQKISLTIGIFGL
jgi:hypothetical protein